MKYILLIACIAAWLFSIVIIWQKRNDFEFAIFIAPLVSIGLSWATYDTFKNK
jgi:hypothetical protein